MARYYGKIESRWPPEKAFAYMADITPPQSRARAYGLIGAAFSAASNAGQLALIRSSTSADNRSPLLDAAPLKLATVPRNSRPNPFYARVKTLILLLTGPLVRRS